MTIEAPLLLAAALFGIGVYGALGQQAFVMIMMGLELMLSGAIVAAVTFWAFSGGGTPKGQLLPVVLLTVMAVETAIGFALVVNVYRIRKAELTEKVRTLRA